MRADGKRHCATWPRRNVGGRWRLELPAYMLWMTEVASLLNAYPISGIKFGRLGYGDASRTYGVGGGILRENLRIGDHFTKLGDVNTNKGRMVGW